MRAEEVSEPVPPNERAGHHQSYAGQAKPPRVGGDEMPGRTEGVNQGVEQALGRAVPLQAELRLCASQLEWGWEANLESRH